MDNRGVGAGTGNTPIQGTSTGQGAGTVGPFRGGTAISGDPRPLAPIPPKPKFKRSVPSRAEIPFGPDGEPIVPNPVRPKFISDMEVPSYNPGGSNQPHLKNIAEHLEHQKKYKYRPKLTIV